MNLIYCLKCKKNTDTLKTKEEITKNGRMRLIGNCSICLGNKGSFIKKI
jgi:hypothetical protein